MEYLNSEEVDFAAYLKATETQEKIREARVYLEKLKNDLLNPKVVTKITMPWGKTLNQFDFRLECLVLEKHLLGSIWQIHGITRKNQNTPYFFLAMDP